VEERTVLQPDHVQRAWNIYFNTENPISDTSLFYDWLY